MTHYLNQIDRLLFIPITSAIWETIQLEGLDEEYDALNRKDWNYAQLQITEDDVLGLKSFDEKTINKFNQFDIDLKNNYKKLIDFIDYEKGSVKIIKCLK